MRKTEYNHFILMKQYYLRSRKIKLVIYKKEVFLPDFSLCRHLQEPKLIKFLNSRGGVQPLE